MYDMIIKCSSMAVCNVVSFDVVIYTKFVYK